MSENATIDSASTSTATPSAPPSAPKPPAADTTPLSEAMQELDQFGAEDAKLAARRPAIKRPEVKEPKMDKEKETSDEAEQAEPEPAKSADEKSVEPAPVKPVKAAELRAAYEKSKETIKQKDAELTKLREELKTKSKPAEDPEKSSLKEKFEQADKRRQELENEIKFVAYQKSEEFVKQYKQPYEEAWTKAVAELSELTIEGEDGSVRKATASDLVALSNMPLGEARKAAKQMFGDAADDVMAHRRKIRELYDAQNKALETAQKTSQERFKQQEEQSLQQREKMQKLWMDENNVWQERYPKFFKPEEGDEEGNALLARGYAMADTAFSGNGGKSPEEMVKLHAEVRNKAAAFPRLALRLKKARERIKELETSLADYEKSEPPAGEGRRTTMKVQQGNDILDAMGELDALEKKGR